MNKPLKRTKLNLFHYNDKGEMVEGAHDKISGNATGLRGDVSELTGNCDEIPKDARPCDINDFVNEETKGE